MRDKLGMEDRSISTETTEAARSLDALFRPQSVAVIGASREASGLGWRVLHNLLQFGLNGKVFPVNPHAEQIHSVRAWPDIREVPDPVDLAMVVVPRDEVLPVVRACGEKGVRAVVVLSAGFREMGAEGARREAALMEEVREYGMRMVGPNCMGLINTDLEIRLNASFAPIQPRRGPIALISQSGALGVTLLEQVHGLNLGISKFVSVGNVADVSVHELLAFLGDDPETGVILLYLESFTDAPAFAEAARTVSRRKPILVVKGGRSQAGRRAAISHTGALAALDQAVDGFLEGCGVLRADSMEELFHLAMAFVSQPLPRGRRVAIVTNGGGPGILAADAAERHGLVVTELTEKTRRVLRPLLPPESSVANPVDLLATSTPAQFGQAARLLVHAEEVDALIAIFVPPKEEETEAAVQAVTELSGGGKPILACLRTREGMLEARGRTPSVPNYSYPETCAGVTAGLADYLEVRERPAGEFREFEADRDRVEEFLKMAEEEGREQLSLGEAIECMGAYGIPMAPIRPVDSPDDLSQVVERWGFPVVLKADVSGHKTEAGAVRLGLDSLEAALEAWRSLRDRFGMDARILAQPHLQEGHEVVMGMVRDPLLGPVILFGLGGIHVELLQDIAFRPVPLTDQAAFDLLGAVRAGPILRGHRGGTQAELTILAEVLQRLSRLAEHHPTIQEMEVNPFLAAPTREGSVGLDARIVLAKGNFEC